LAVSKVLAASSSLPNLTIIGAQSRPYGAMEPKKANKSNFNTGLSAGNYYKNYFSLIHLHAFWYEEMCRELQRILNDKTVFTLA